MTDIKKLLADANPWVWALKFDVIQQNVDEVMKQCE